MKPLPMILLAIGTCLAALTVNAQPMPPVPRDVVNLSATAVVEAVQDQLTLSLSSSRDGTDPALVQEQLKTALDAALADARTTAQPGAMEVRTGHFSLQPRHGRDGRISAWQGTAELVLEGRDFERIGLAAGRIQGMTVASVVFGLSRLQRETLEAQAQAQAIERFRARAVEIARAFGFSAYALREVHVNSQDQGVVMRPRLMAAAVRSVSADTALPLEAGKASVQVTVSGAVQLR